MNIFISRAGASAIVLLAGSAAAQAMTGCPVGAPASCLTSQGSWTTTLQPRDYGDDGAIDAYYDTLLDLTWLADGNYAGTIGQPNQGKMNWFQATTWVGNLNLFGGADWRLPTLTPVNGVAFNYTNSFDGTTDVGYALQNVGWGHASELGHMYYVTLGNDGLGDGTWRPDSTGPFRNLLEAHYYTNVPYAPSQFLAWAFDMDNGRQSTAFKQGWIGGDEGGYPVAHPVWAVHEGDLIGPPVVPAPEVVAVPMGPVWPYAVVLGAVGAARLARRAT